MNSHTGEHTAGKNSDTDLYELGKERTDKIENTGGNGSNFTIVVAVPVDAAGFHLC